MQTHILNEYTCSWKLLRTRKYVIVNALCKDHPQSDSELFPFRTKKKTQKTLTTRISTFSPKGQVSREFCKGHSQKQPTNKEVK